MFSDDYCKSISDSVGEGILIIGQRVVKIRAILWAVLFFRRSTVYYE